MSNRYASVTPLWLTIAVPLLLAAGCNEDAPSSAPDEGSASQVLERVNEGALTLSQGEAACRCRLETVRLGGTVFHFGLDLAQSPPAFFPFQSTVAGTRVWVAELPVTRRLNLRADSEGKWSFSLVKVKGTPLPFSLVYEHEGYVTTKSQVLEVGDTGIRDLAVQLPTVAYYAAAKAQIEQQIGALIGAPYQLDNILVTTVGKAWASMYNPDLPHGDPGATVQSEPAITFPASVGPIYFNEAVSPDPSLTSTSVDGGVMFGNLPNGRVRITATKAPFTYAPLTFVIQDGIGLYIASPPHATQGTNTSPPGQP